MNQQWGGPFDDRLVFLPELLESAREGSAEGGFRRVDGDMALQIHSSEVPALAETIEAPKRVYAACPVCYGLP